MSFRDLGLLQELVEALIDKGYEEPTPIQQQSIPAILEGGDLLAAAQTGTGKTAGFTLPLLQNLMASHKPRPALGIRALILTPTRELAAQVLESVKTYGRHLPLKAAVVFGGVNINPQIHALQRGVDILVATPGRLLDLVAQKAVLLSSVEILVLDEADRMLDMGFIHDIRRVLALLPKKRQNLLFSATFSEEIKTLASGFLHEPKLIEVAKSNSAASGVEQIVHPVDSKRKRELLSHLIREGQWQQVLVFTRTKHGANRLTTQLEADGITAMAIHGNKSQGARTKALAEFKTGKIRVLVATDIAARGLDIDQLPHVVNYDLPNVPEDYVHRIGRTARAGREGTAISLVCIDEHKLLRDIERLMKKQVPSQIIAGFEPDPSIAAEPIPNGRNRQARSPQSSRGPRHEGQRPSPSGRSSPTRPGLSHAQSSERTTHPRKESSRAAPTERMAGPRRESSGASQSERTAHPSQGTSRASHSERTPHSRNASRRPFGG